MRTYRALHREQGFTLIEMMMTVMLIGILGVDGRVPDRRSASRDGRRRRHARRDGTVQPTRARPAMAQRRRDPDRRSTPTNNRLRTITPPLPGRPSTRRRCRTSRSKAASSSRCSPALRPTRRTRSATAARRRLRRDADHLFNTDGMLVDGSGSAGQRHGLPHSSRISRSRSAPSRCSARSGRVRGYRWNGTTWTRA